MVELAVHWSPVSTVIGESNDKGIPLIEHNLAIPMIQAPYFPIEKLQYGHFSRL